MTKIKPIEGYDYANYAKNTGINNDSISQQVIEQVYDLMLDGYSASEIHHALIEAYHWNSQAEKYVYNKAYKLLNEKTAKEEEYLKEKQLQRLLKLYRKCQANSDRKQELATLAEINKLNSLYIQKVELTNNEVIFRIDGEAEETESN